MSSSNNILVLNCGSSSLKFAIINPKTEEEFLSGLAECFNLPEARVKWKLDGKKEEAALGSGAAHSEAIQFIVDTIFSKKPELLTSLSAVGHRIVHGGEKYTQSILIDDSVVDGIEEVAKFAPLHNPAHLIGIRESFRALPHLKHKNVAVFDTAFHTTMPKSAYLYAIPQELYIKHGVRRYGFHGTSHFYITGQAAKLLNKPLNEVNIISCHLGNGASVAAIKNGKCIDTSMGFTPLEGLVMGTRSGDIDPAIVFFLHDNLNMTFGEINDLLNKKSGFLGLTGVTSDCRYVSDNYETNEEAKLTLDIFVNRLVKYIGGYAMLLDGRLDALIFTGGIGENAEDIRRMTLEKLGMLNFKLDQPKNLSARFGQSGLITQADSTIAMVIPTNEELVIAQDTANLTA